MIRRSAMPKRAWRSRSSFRICASMVTSSAVVGSSAIRRSGSLASAMAIITRCRWPPESWCGYASRRRSASGSPTRCRSSTVRARAAWRESPLWTNSTSLTCFSIVWSGLSDVIGSWKIIAIRLPRTRRSVASSAPRSSWPWNRMLPEGWRAGGYGRSWRMDSAVTDFPDPLSPTSPTVSPLAMSSETPRTARTSPPGVSNETDRSRIARRGAAAITRSSAGRTRRGRLRR